MWLIVMAIGCAFVIFVVIGDSVQRMARLAAACVNTSDVYPPRSR
jgi:hypothetical protein